MPTPEQLTLTQQRYLETVFGLHRDTGRARVTDLARRLQISLPSASETLKRLIDRGLVVRKSRHELALSRRGQSIARKLDRRHAALRRFMVEVLAMDGAAAEQNACRMEHFAGPQLIERCVALVDFLQHQSTGADCLKEFRTRCKKN